MPRQRFKVFYAEDSEDLERKMNAWLDELGPQVKLRRTQLAAATNRRGDVVIYALVSYEVLPGPDQTFYRCSSFVVDAVDETRSRRCELSLAHPGPHHYEEDGTT